MSRSCRPVPGWLPAVARVCQPRTPAACEGFVVPFPGQRPMSSTCRGAAKRSVRVLPAGSVQARGGGAGLEWQINPCEPSSLFAGAATPDRHHRHPVSRGTEEVQRSGTRLVPKGNLQRLAGRCRTEISRVPMGQAGRASHVRATVIGDLEDNPHRTSGATGKVRLVDMSHALCLGLRSGGRAETDKKSRDTAAERTQALET